MWYGRNLQRPWKRVKPASNEESLLALKRYLLTLMTDCPEDHEAIELQKEIIAKYEKAI